MAGRIKPTGAGHGAKKRNSYDAKKEDRRMITTAFNTFWKRPALILAFVLLAFPAVAQTATSAGSDPAAIQKLIDDARKSGAKIVVIETTGPTAMAAGQALKMPSIADRLEAEAFEFRDRLTAILHGASGFVGETMTTLRDVDLARNANSDRSLTWIALVLMFMTIHLTVGYGVERLFRRWARPHFSYMFNPTPQSRAEKIGYLLLSGMLQIFSIALQILTAFTLIVVFAPEEEHIRNTEFIILGTVAAIRILGAFFRAFLAVGAPSHRMVHATDAAAENVYRALLTAIIVIGIAIGMCLWMEALGLNENAHKLGLIGATLISSTLFGFFALRRRADVAGMLLGADPESQATWWRLFARTWHGLAVVYATAAFCVTVVRLVLDIPDVFALVTGPVVVLLGSLSLFGVALLIIEWAFSRKKPTARIMPLATGDDAADGISESVQAAMEDDESYALERHHRSFKDVAEHAAAILVTAIAAWAIFAVWGVNLAQSGTIAHAVWEVVLIVVLAWLAFEAVDIAIDRKIEDEGGYITAAPGEEGSGGGTSRVTTLLPLFRNFLLIVIVIIAGMVALAELGVDIAPLFAGAGVLGLAIGFGAQSLIKDIFSGAFFLLDDAFRIGEYIDVGSVKGSVEKISLRSMQLRHHRGALHTIPFGEIKHLTNYSRDWVMMKLPLRVNYNTDVDKVRKLVKNLGKELMAHPEVGHMFMQPLKSQGVFKMEDSAMIIRVKFMTKPGEQFMTRKVVYAEIQKLFDENDIEFAHQRVTVHVAEDDPGSTAADRPAVAAAGAQAAGLATKPGPA
ncbi:MAG: small-conductance mechanosensitive channel [Alphaproteobacteria bacterium]